LTKTIIEQAKDECRAVNRVISTYAERIDRATEIAYQYGQIDGDHHKNWVIDQMLRTLLADGYDAWIKAAINDGTEEWDTGIAP
jgi:hypothetical protein